MGLSAEQVAQFKVDGYLVVRGALASGRRRHLGGGGSALYPDGVDSAGFVHGGEWLPADYSAHARRGIDGASFEEGVGTTIVEEELPDTEIATLPMERGDVLLLHKEIPHRSLANQSETIRWSMDLRYQETGTPTGRPFHPDFPVRSRANPNSVLVDYEEWCRMWVEALEESRKQKVQAHRWKAVE